MDAVALRAAFERREAQKTRLPLHPELLFSGLSGVDLDDHARAAGFAIQNFRAVHLSGIWTPVFHEIRIGVVVARPGVGRSATPQFIRLLIVARAQQIEKASGLVFFGIVLKSRVGDSAHGQDGYDNYHYAPGDLLAPLITRAVMIEIAGHGPG